MSRVQVTAADLSVVEGPAYEVQSEDGPYTSWDVLVVYRDRQPDAMTWGRTFGRRGGEEAHAWVAHIVGYGSIDASKWSKGDPWLAYHGGMTLEERWAPYGPAWQAEQEAR